MFFGLPALIVMAQLQSLLSAMHLPGETAYSLRDLAFPDRADAAIETWFAHSRETTQQFSGPGLVTLLFALVDTFVFVPAYTIVFSVARGDVVREAAVRRRTTIRCSPPIGR